MSKSARTVAAVAACAMLTVAQQTVAQTGAIPPGLTTPDKVETRIGTLEFKDGAPTVETAEKVRDTLDFTRALNVFNNSFRGASAYAIRQGLPQRRRRGQHRDHLLRTDGRQVAVPHRQRRHRLLHGGGESDQGPDGGRAAARWGWAPSTTCGSAGSSTSASPVPIAAKAASTCSCRPATTARFPRAASTSRESKTNRVLYAARSFLVNNDPKPAVETDQEVDLKIYPYTPGGVGTSIATALDGKVRLAKNPPVPETKFVEGSGKSFNTIPPNDFSFFEMINENVQQEPATSYDVELAGQLAAIGIVKGKPFKPDARMKKILTDAAAVGNAAGRMLNWRYACLIPTGRTTPARCGATCCGRAAPTSRRRRRSSPGKACSSRSRRPAPARSIRARRSTTATRSTRRA